MNENNNGGKFFDRSNIDEMTNSNFPNENQNNVFFDSSMLNAVSNGVNGQSNDMFVSQEIDANKANEEQYQYIIDNAKKDDVYWDRNNIFVKAILIALFSFAFVGTICFLLLWFSGE